MIDMAYLVFVGAAINLFGGFAYIRETLAGRTRPNRISWLLWSIAPMIATGAGIAKGVGLAVVPVFMSGFIPFLVFLASFLNRKGFWRLQTSDYACGLFSLLALVLWGITKEPNIAIVFAIASDLLAAVPTIMKSWSHPESESAVAFLTGLLNALTGFAVVESWNFSGLAFPVYLSVVNMTLILVIERRRIFFWRNPVSGVADISINDV
ncbi:MAG: hypothetical protein HGB18_01805 [Candidatus Moranbacteria bacterium]|nr:hypothetical protein [Candidatus Moranbacteria bacterium]